jgi:membrane protease YdiL (CAAX protease family)
MEPIRYKLLEFFIIFIVLPVSFAIPYPVILKFILGIIGFVYVIYVLLKIENNRFKIAPNLNWKRFWTETSIKLLIIAILTSVFVWFTDREMFFEVVINKPLLWLVILIVYSLFSVYPQELVYRTLYFQRYEQLFKSKKLFIFINAVVFSLAHTMFRNPLVHIITFLGGILFALTYNKTKSTLLVSIEHAIYGSWLFTIGMGNMLGFPS